MGGDRRRRWLPIAIGVTFLLVCIAVGLVVVVVSMFRQNVDTQTSNETDASVAFADVRRQFADKAPLLEMRDGKPHRMVIAGERRSTAELQHLKLMVWNPHDNHLTRVTLPFWLLRMKSTPINLGSYASGLDDSDGHDLRVEDLEAYGPGIVLEHTSSKGDQVIVWLE